MSWVKAERAAREERTRLRRSKTWTPTAEVCVSRINSMEGTTAHTMRYDSMEQVKQLIDKYSGDPDLCEITIRITNGEVQ